MQYDETTQKFLDATYEKIYGRIKTAKPFADRAKEISSPLEAKLGPLGEEFKESLLRSSLIPAIKETTTDWLYRLFTESEEDLVFDATRLKALTAKLPSHHRIMGVDLEDAKIVVNTTLQVLLEEFSKDYVKIRANGREYSFKKTDKLYVTPIRI